MPHFIANYIQSRYASGTDWYRIYSDSYMEQGGKATAEATTTELSLLLPYKDMDYWCFNNIQASDTGNAHSNYMYAEPTGKGKMEFGSHIAGKINRWKTSGYMNITNLRNPYICIKY